jgi:hypothetical protein
VFDFVHPSLSFMTGAAIVSIAIVIFLAQNQPAGHSSGDREADGDSGPIYCLSR